jgi:Putative MetA-pathway of phenol degradation
VFAVYRLLSARLKSLCRRWRDCESWCTCATNWPRIGFSLAPSRCSPRARPALAARNLRSQPIALPSPTRALWFPEDTCYSRMASRRLAAKESAASIFPRLSSVLGSPRRPSCASRPPDYFQNFNLGKGFASGRGDLSLGVKQQLVATSASFDASLIVVLSVPTGANALSSHGYDPQFLLLWSHPISKNWTTAGMFALLWPTQGATRNLTGQLSFLFDRQITNRWDAFIEYAGDFPQRGTPQQLLHLGTAFKITSNQQFDFHVGVGLSSAAVDHFIGLGYSFQARMIHRAKRGTS